MPSLPFAERSELVLMKLEPWKVEGKQTVEPVTVLFNPTEYTLEHSTNYAEIGIPGLEAPIIQFVRGNTEKLNFDLLIDTTDKELGSEERNAAKIAENILKMARIDGARHAPSVVKFSWADLEFDGVIESLRRQVVLFDRSGTPIRINLSLSVKRYRTLAEQLSAMNPQSRDRTQTIVVEQGDTLPRVASRAYGDDTLWRPIAEANGILDPLSIVAGQVLRVPRDVGA